MKTHAKKFGLGAILVVSAFTASALPATYSVDMGVQMSLGNFNPGAGDLVRVAGTFTTPDWVTTSILSVNPTNSNIYEGTFNGDQAAADFENHKFIIDVGGAGTTLNWESIGNRFFQIPNAATNLATVYFNDVTPGSTIITTQVTFNVNMGVQIQLGNFNPASDFVYVAGDAINNWVTGISTLAPSLADTNIYTGTFDITNNVGATVNFKYVMNTFAGGLVWENNGVGPGGGQNRQFSFPNTATNLPVEFFNNITNASSLVMKAITFEVNTAVQHALGNFDPSIGTITVAGDAINNWSAIASPLTQSPSNANLWTGTFIITNTVGGAVNYKFVMNGGGTWESIADRQFIFPDVNTALPGVFFNNLATLGNLTISNMSPSDITFSWGGGANIRLQRSGSLPGSWSDVPDTAGQSTATVSKTGGEFFRLVGP